MTYHADLAPSRRPWLIAAPLAIVVALAVAWTGLWFYAAGEAEVRLNEWRAQQARSGRVFDCASQSVGGFPFRIEARCTRVAAELKDAQPPIAIKLKEILAVAQVWDPKLVIAEFSGPLTASEPGGAPYLTATWGLAQASVRGTPAAPERASVVIDGLFRFDPAELAWIEALARRAPVTVRLPRTANDAVLSFLEGRWQSLSLRKRWRHGCHPDREK